MPRPSNAIATLYRLSWRDWLLVARLALFVVPFRHLVPRLGGTTNATLRAGLPGGDLGSRVAWAVRAASHRAPWTTKCFAEAIAAKWMLNRRHVASTLHLGLMRGTDGELLALAWLRCGSRILTGGPSPCSFTTVATFGESPSHS